MTRLSKIGRRSRKEKYREKKYWRRCSYLASIGKIDKSQVESDIFNARRRQKEKAGKFMLYESEEDDIREELAMAATCWKLGLM